MNGRLAAAILSVLLACSPAIAQTPAETYPAGPVRIIVPFGPGGPSDVLARIVAQRLQTTLGQPVVVENRPGAGGTLASTQVAKSAPDGLTLMMHTAGSYTAAYLHRSAPYDPVKDFAPIIRCASYPFYLVANPQLPAQSVGELIALARREPGKLSYSSVGIGAAGHLVMEMFKKNAGIDIIHVPYKSAPQSVADIVSGQVSLAFDTIGTSQSLVAAGKLKGLAVSSAKRSAAVPDVPTIAESGLPGFEAYLWVGLFAPTGTPASIIARLNAEAQKIFAQPEVSKLITGIGGDYAANSTADFAAFLAKETPKWRQTIAETGARVE